MTNALDTSGWDVARLIPTSGISGADEQERRAVSAVLSVMSAVREFGLAIVRPLGAPAGTLEAYIEVEFPIGERKVRPDGVLRVARGQRSWTALVEVKTGTNDLERAQLEDYLDVARDHGFDALLTISNQIAAAPGVHPVDVDKRKLRKVNLIHLSWTELLSIAVVQREHRGIADPDQAWILDELIRYLEHEKSGALDFSDMGAAWPAVREAVTARTLRPSDKGAIEVVGRWEQLLTFASLRMERALGTPVRVVRSRKEAADPSLRTQTAVAALVRDGSLIGTLRVPGAIDDLTIEADLRTQKIAISIRIDAPREGRALTRVNWLLRQLADAPEGMRVDATAAFARDSHSELLKDARANPELLVGDAKSDLRSFTLTATSTLGPNRLAGRNGFVNSVIAAIEGFYSTVVQTLRPWAPKAPQLRPDASQAPIAAPALAEDYGDLTDLASEQEVGNDVTFADEDADNGEPDLVPVEAIVSWPAPLVTHATLDTEPDDEDTYTVELSSGHEVTITADDLDDAGRIAETELLVPDGSEPVRVTGPDGTRALDDRDEDEPQPDGETVPEGDPTGAPPASAASPEE